MSQLNGGLVSARACAYDARSGIRVNHDDDPTNESVTSLAEAWGDLERAFVAALLNEISMTQATDRMKAALQERLGLASSLLNGHHPVEDSAGEHILIGSSPDGTAMTLVLSRRAVFEGAQRERLRRLYEALIQASRPLHRSGPLLHQLRNRLTGLQANVEFAELMTSDAQAVEPTPQREEILTALKHAMNACAELSKTLGAIEGQERR